MERKVYADHSATTAVRPEVLEAMLPYFTEEYGNPSSIYAIARSTKQAVETAREQVAMAINAKADEIFFTGCGTESDNWALKGIAESYAGKGDHIITTAVEHHAILHTCQYLEKQGKRITYLPVDEDGAVSVEALKNAVDQDTILAVSYTHLTLPTNSLV